MALPKTRPVLSILALGMAAASFAAAPASAETRKPVSVEFTYNLEESAATNYRNLLVKVKRACTQQGPRSVAYMPAERACIAGMTNLAVAQIDKPDLSVAHAAAVERYAERRQLAAQ
jgi:hypothetical protein